MTEQEQAVWDAIAKAFRDFANDGFKRRDIEAALGWFSVEEDRQKIAQSVREAVDKLEDTELRE